MLDGKSNVKGVSKGSTIFGVGGKKSLAPFLCIKIENK